MVAEGKIPWGFWPPGGSVSGDDGIWLKDGVQQHAWDALEIDEEGSGDQDSEMEAPRSSDEDSKFASGESDDDDGGEEDKSSFRGGNLGRFGALRIDD